MVFVLKFSLSKYDFDELSNWTKYHVNKVHVGLIFPWQLFKLVMSTVWRTNWNFSIRKAIVCNFPCFSKNIVRVKRNRKLQYVRDRDRKKMYFPIIFQLWVCGKGNLGRGSNLPFDCSPSVSHSLKIKNIAVLSFSFFCLIFNVHPLTFPHHS